MKFLGQALKYLGNDVYHQGNDGSGSGLDAGLLEGNPASYFAVNPLEYTTVTGTAEAWYRLATIPMTAQFKNTIFKVTAKTATGTQTQATITVDCAYYSGNYGSQSSSIIATSSHSYNVATSAENGYVLLYARVSFDGTNGYIDVYKYKTTAVTIVVEPYVVSDWQWVTGTTTANPTVGSYRSTSVTLYAGLSCSSITVPYASNAAYSSYGVLGTNTLSNTTDKTGQWEYFGNIYILYNSSYLRGHSCNIRVRLQEVSYNGTSIDLDDFVVNISMSLPYHADSTAFNTTVPIFSVTIEGKTTLTGNDIAALVYSTSTANKYIRFYLKLKSANTVYQINPEQRYGRSFATSNYGQTTSYCYFNYAGDATPVAELPTPAQGSIVYATKPSIYESPALTGVPTAPTAAPGTNTTQIATTEYVQNAMSSAGAGDMLKSVYDTDGDGVVDKAEKLQYDANRYSELVGTRFAILNKTGKMLVEGSEGTQIAFNARYDGTSWYKLQDNLPARLLTVDANGFIYHEASASSGSTTTPLTWDTYSGTQIWHSGNSGDMIIDGGTF